MFVPNFKILGAVVPEKSSDTNFPMHYIGVRDGKKEKKRRQNRFQHLLFFFTHYISTLYRCIQNSKTLALIGAEKSVTKNSFGEKEKTDK